MLRRPPVVAALLVLLGTAGAQEIVEDEVKAAYLLNFANPKYMTWPEDAVRREAPFVIGVLGEHPILGFLERSVKGKAVGARPAQARKVKDAADARGCSILFLAASELPQAAELRNSLAGAGVLIVGDAPEFAEQGAHLAFAMVDRRVRFDVNPGALAAGGLQPTAQLLRVARRVIKGDAPK